MPDTDSFKTEIAAPKPLMPAGPTLHYSHANVNGCYFLAVCVYYFAAVFWSKLMTGSLICPYFPGPFYLEKLILSPLSIFEYPAQIFVIGLLVGIFIAAPILISQLMSFYYSIFPVLILAFIAGLPGLAIAVFIGAFAAALRPLRFRSRFIAIVLCISPSLIYFGFFGGAKNMDNVRWALSFAPWLDGILTALAISAVVLIIGHFTRYRPGLIWSIIVIILIAAIIIFQNKIGLSELDYQLYIAGNNPEAIKEFQDNSITEALDRTLTSPKSRSYFQSPFYPVEPIELRAVLKKEIQTRLLLDRWPEWFDEPGTLGYQAEKQRLLKQYENFINPRKQWWKPEVLHNALLKSKVRIRRMPIALYYKGLLSEMSPELNTLVEKEILHFYNNYPHRENLPIWHRLYSEYPDSTESIEARWRRAVHLAGMEEFDHARQLTEQAVAMAKEELARIADISVNEIEAIFHKPAATVITEYELKRIKRKLRYLQHLISDENLGSEPKDKRLLAQFILLNPHDILYKTQLENLLNQTTDTSPLKDNIVLAQTMLISDVVLRAQRLGEVAKKFAGTDGGIQANFEQASLKLTIWKEHTLSDTEKEKYLTEAKKDLQDFINNYPDSIFAEQAAEKLAVLPAN
ncbi:MAG: hypothetical protein PHQ00_01300 [Phycisphaerae bacterium]|nr:hypothetical protein [Phycisphaerae bacterium]